MPVIRRSIIGSEQFIGATTSDGMVRAVPKGAPSLVHSEVGIDAPAAEPELFNGRRVLLTMRTVETAAATRDWLRYHAENFGVDAALILDRNPPGHCDSSLQTDMNVVVVDADQPLSSADENQWHGPLAEFGVFELLRHRFLSRAKSLAVLDIADLLSRDIADPFEVAEAAPGWSVPLRGLEIYPWRLRKGTAAPHGDHIARLWNETRWLLSWAISPAGLSDGAVMGPGRVVGAPVSATSGQFVRCMGVQSPGVPVSKLVRKPDLVEDPHLVGMMSRVLNHKPLRMPAPKVVTATDASGPIVVVSAMKDEGPFVLDWIAHHRVLGVNRFLIYTNDCSDGTDTLLDALKDAGVERRDNPYKVRGGVPQRAAFRAAGSEPIVTQAAWHLTLDVDEYLNVHVGNGTLRDLMGATDGANAISMPWRLFGNADLVAYEDIPVTARFPLAAPAFAPRPLQAWGFKTLYRNDGLFRRLGVHRPKEVMPTAARRLKWVNGSGEPLPTRHWARGWRMTLETWGYDLVQINHYAVRSAESFLVKRARGRVNHVRRDQGAAYWFRMNHNAEQDNSIQRYADATRREREALSALPGVSQIHADCVSWHRDRIAELRREPEQAKFFELITSDRMEKLSRIATRFGMTAFQDDAELPELPE